MYLRAALMLDRSQFWVDLPLKTGKLQVVECCGKSRNFEALPRRFWKYYSLWSSPCLSMFVKTGKKYVKSKQICRKFGKLCPPPPPYLELSFCHCRCKPFKTTPISQNRDCNTSPTQVHNVAPLLNCHVVLRILFTSL